MKGARINFGVPNSEYVLLANDNGEAVSLKNQDTDTEYIGGGAGGGSFLTITNVSSEGKSIDGGIFPVEGFNPNDVSLTNITVIPVAGMSIPFPASTNDYLVVLFQSDIVSISGEYEEITGYDYRIYKILGNVTIEV